MFCSWQYALPARTLEELPLEDLLEVDMLVRVPCQD